MDLGRNVPEPCIRVNDNDFSWLGLNLVWSVAWSFGVQLVVFISSGISVVLFDTLGISRGHNPLILSSHHL